MINIGVIGNGFVGKATKLLECENINILAYDKSSEQCEPLGTTLSDLLVCSIIFISVPTPMNNDGSCFLGIIHSVLSDLNDLNYNGSIVLRSTVPPGTSDNLNCYFMPEFLTEKNFEYDFINNKDWVFGLLKNNNVENFKKDIRELFDIGFSHGKIKYNTIHFVSNSEAEMIKMFKNCFLATKVSFCNEMNSYCEKNGICYENVRKIAANDDRILHNHTRVPGHDGHRGYGGTCFPKDTNSMVHEMNRTDTSCHILKSVVERNETIDRPNKDWFLNTGRAVI
jgi:UDPglucose 6-dehydrogenase